MIYKRTCTTLLCLLSVGNCFHLFFFFLFSHFFPHSRERRKGGCAIPYGHQVAMQPHSSRLAEMGQKTPIWSFLQNFVVKGLGLLWAFGSGEDSWVRAPSWPMATVPVPNSSL